VDQRIVSPIRISPQSAAKAYNTEVELGGEDAPTPPPAIELPSLALQER